MPEKKYETRRFITWHSSQSIIKEIKLRRMNWAGHVARMTGMRYSSNIFIDSKGFWRWCITIWSWVFWTLSIVWYSKKTHNVSKNGTVQWLKLALSNWPNWAGDPLPYTWGRKQIQFSKRCVFLEYQTDKLQKFSSPEYFCCKIYGKIAFG
jgi:hypothetical protein